MVAKKILKTNINKDIIEIDFEKLLSDFGMSYETFVDYCILSGCDYTDTISQIGPVTSFNMMIKHGNIEKYLEDNRDKNTSKFDYVTARSIFTTFDYELPCKKFTKNSYNKDKLLSFLVSNNFKENVIKKFIKILN